MRYSPAGSEVRRAGGSRGCRRGRRPGPPAPTTPSRTCRPGRRWTVEHLDPPAAEVREEVPADVRSGEVAGRGVVERAAGDGGAVHLVGALHVGVERVAVPAGRCAGAGRAAADDRPAVVGAAGAAVDLLPRVGRRLELP